MGIMIKGRNKPYTESGISRVPCLRCNKPSACQWQICSLGNKYFGVCGECDIELNGLVLDFFRVPNSGDIIKRYMDNGHFS